MIEKISRIVVIDLEDWQLRALQQLAEENGCGLNELINRVVRERLEGEMSAQPEPGNQLTLFS